MLGLLVTYDPDVDVLYVSLREREPGEITDHTVELDESRFVHYDARDEPLGVEFLWASDGVNVDGVPESDAIVAAMRAFRQVPTPSPAAR